MQSSTLQQYFQSGLNYTWDSVTGFLYTSGGLNFFIAILIIFGVISLGILLIKNIFGFK